MLYRVISLLALCLWSLAGCGQSGPETTVIQAGTKVTYRTRSVPSLHGSITSGELWLAKGDRFRDLFGCSPYFAAAPNDAFIVLCRQLPDERRELIILNTSDGDWFTVPKVSAEIGCGGVTVSRDESGILKIVRTGPSGVSTLLIDTNAKRKVGSSYIRNPEAEGSTSEATVEESGEAK